MTCNNGAGLVQLPYKNVSLPSVGPDAFSRGIPINLGTPPQTLSLLPIITNHTYVGANISQVWTLCSVNYPPLACKAMAGGGYNPFNSSTVVLTSLAHWNDSDQDPLSEESQAFADTYEISYVLDTVHLPGNRSAYGMPLAYVEFSESEFDAFEGFLGLAPYSSFLNTLVASNAVSSTVWSIWTGSRSITEPLDGLLIIGGYDEARLAGELHNFTTHPDCMLSVKIAKISYERNGQEISLFSSPTHLKTACIDITSHRLELPSEAIEKFINVTNATYNITSGELNWLPGQMLGGNITITLSNGYVTTIPETEIFEPPRLWNSKGEYEIIPGPTISTVSYGSPGFALTLGQPFMSMNYIVVDYANSMFQMAPANRSKFPNPEEALAPKVICRDEHPETRIFTGSAALPTDSNFLLGPAGSIQSSSPTFIIMPKAKTSTVVGIIAGTALGIALLVLTALVVLTRYHKIVKRRARLRRRSGATRPLLKDQHDSNSDDKSTFGRITRERSNTA